MSASDISMKITLSSVGIVRNEFNDRPADPSKIRKELSKILFTALGADGIKKYFNRETVWGPKSGLDQKRYELTKSKREKIDKVLKPSADTVKDKTEKVT